MARLKKGILVFNDASGEFDGPGIEGRTIKYGEVLLDWLNRAWRAGHTDREAAERVGALIKDMNDSAVEYLEAVNDWRSEGEGQPLPICKTFRAIASSYGLEIDACPQPGSKKWQLAFLCVAAPSGEAFEPDSGIVERWPDVPTHFNPECQAVNAVLFIALEGRLGKIRRCVNCDAWFLSKDDNRVLFCRNHKAEDLRRDTEKRKLRAKAAAKAARDQARDKERKYWEEQRRRRPGPHRAGKSRRH